MISPGNEWRGKIDEQINNADIILLLISVDFINSEYYYDIEMKRAMERHESGEARVVPIIIRPVDWSGAPFEKLLALPEDGKPLTTWKDLDEAFVNVTKSIRKIIQRLDVNLLVTPSNKTERLWQLKIKDKLKEFTNQEDIARNLREISKDNNIIIKAISLNDNIIILQGSNKAFEIIKKLLKENKLSNELGVNVEYFTKILGATIKTSVDAENSYPVGQFIRSDLMIFPTEKSATVLPKGITVHPDDPLKYDFLIDSTGTGIAETELKKETKKLLNYFIAAMTINEKDLWVNLSPYESNRMIPKVLDGTEFGRDLLKTDCLLKRLTSSLLYPESETGKEYWEAVYHKIHKHHGTTQMKIDTFQKVWIIPEEAFLYEGNYPLSEDDELDKSLERLFPQKFDKGKFAFVVNTRLKVMVEKDYLAFKEKLNNQIDLEVVQDINELCIPVFREVILPKIEKEVNEGESFKLLRQMYHATILASWYKQNYGDNPISKKYIDKGKRGDLNPKILDMKSLRSEDDSCAYSQETVRSTKETISEMASLSDNELNGIFYRQYLDLFQNGIYKCFRKQFDSNTKKIITRTYFSGAIYLGSIQIQVQKLKCCRKIVTDS